MIPRILHYCWYGQQQKPKRIKKYMETWSKIGERWDVIEWNETNCDFNCNGYVKGAAQVGKFAFISDYFRLTALYKYGGVYLDTDVEIYKSFEDMCELEGFCGYMYDSLVGTAVLGFKKHNPFIGALLEVYDRAVWVDISKNLFEIELSDDERHICSSNNEVFTWVILHMYNDFKLDGRRQDAEDFTIFPMQEFEIGSVIGRTHCVHQCEATWKEHSTKREIFKKIKNCAKYIPIIHMDSLIRTISYQRHIRRSVFYERYRADLTRK